ncbi:MAG: multiheme c-type cytochrome, partial [Polyangiaceae bacterium]
MTRASLLDAKTCGSCHADHYNDWAGSMHAYSADDPIFLAMNARGQRETDGGLGTFCVNCHAPMAVRDGKTTDGLNLASLPAQYHGVTCFFCHSIASVDGTHNAAVTISDDLVMRGEYFDPVPNIAHQAKYSTLQDVKSPDSAAMCGTCHDIVVPPQLDGDAGAPIERTFAEWKASAFSGMGGETCGASGCHMVQSPSVRPIAQQGSLTALPGRYYHNHDFPAVDVPLAAAPDGGGSYADAAAEGSDGGVVEPAGVQALLSNALVGDLCVTQLGGIRVILDTPNLGHDFPSGAAQDRRFWAEIVAYKGGSIVYQTGVDPFGSPAFDAGVDPDLWLLRDCIFDGQGKQVDMFWQAASFEGNELPALATFDQSKPGFYAAQKLQTFPRGGAPPSTGVPDRVTLNLWVQPVGLNVLDDLVASGDLDPKVAAAMPTFPVPLAVQLPGSSTSPQLEWTVE